MAERRTTRSTSQKQNPRSARPETKLRPPTPEKVKSIAKKPDNASKGKAKATKNAPTTKGKVPKDTTEQKAAEKRKNENQDDTQPGKKSKSSRDEVEGSPTWLGAFQTELTESLASTINVLHGSLNEVVESIKDAKYEAKSLVGSVDSRVSESNKLVESIVSAINRLEIGLQEVAQSIETGRDEIKTSVGTVAELQQRCIDVSKNVDDVQRTAQDFEGRLFDIEAQQAEARSFADAIAKRVAQTACICPGEILVSPAKKEVSSKKDKPSGSEASKKDRSSVSGVTEVNNENSIADSPLFTEKSEKPLYTEVEVEELYDRDASAEAESQESEKRAGHGVQAVQTPPDLQIPKEVQTSNGTPAPALQRAPRSSGAVLAPSSTSNEQPKTPTNFDYPVFPDTDLDNQDGQNGELITARYKQLIRHWAFKRAVQTSECVYIPAKDQLLEDLVMAAIHCVTEAASMSTLNQKQFALFSSEALAVLGLLMLFPDPEVKATDYEVGRPGRKIFMLLTENEASIEATRGGAKGISSEMLAEYASEGGHHRLAEVSLTKGENDITGIRINVFDSFFTRLSPAVRQKIEDTVTRRLAKMGWLDWEEVRGGVFCVQSAACNQEGNTCGVHVILNAWTRALGLVPNPFFKPTDEFYEEGLRIINLALAGYCDSATIFAFFAHWTFANPAPYSTSVTKFRRTLRIRKTKDLDNYRRQVRKEPLDILENERQLPVVNENQSPDSPTAPIIVWTVDLLRHAADARSLASRLGSMRSRDEVKNWREMLKRYLTEKLQLNVQQLTDEDLLPFYDELMSGEGARRVLAKGGQVPVDELEALRSAWSKGSVKM